MGKETDDIDLIFKKKLLDAPLNVPKDEWKLLDKSLSFRNFFKFGINHINIYYISLFTVLFASASVQFVQIHRLKYENKKMEMIIRKNSQINQTPETNLPVKNGENIISVEKRETIKHTQIENKDNTSLNNQSLKTASITNDSNKIIFKPAVQVNDSITNDVHKNSKIIKKTIYIKNSPVIIRDTVIKHKTYK